MSNTFSLDFHRILYKYFWGGRKVFRPPPEIILGGPRPPPAPPLPTPLARPVAVTGAWTKLHLLSQPSRYKVFLASENFLGQMSAGIKLIKSCSTLHSLTTSIYHFSSYLHATYLFRRRDSVVILPKHASPVMLNEPASASSSAVRLYALEFTGLENW